jgi:outer membrane lipoprotein-sorting protein
MRLARKEKMNRIISMLAVVGLIAFWSAPAARADDSPPTISQTSSVDQVLDALDARGKTLNDFTADVRLQEDDEAVGKSTVRTGKIWFQKLPENDARMRLTLDKKIVQGKTFDDKLEYVYAKGWLTDRDYGRKINKRRQVVRPGEKINLLKLGQGPLPLPLGQDKADVHQLFEVKKIAPAKDDPANTIHLELTPKPGTKYEHKFDAVDFWIDTTSQMPVRIQTADGPEVRTWDLSNTQVNTGLTDKDFTLSPVNEQEWQLSEEPYGQ